MDMMKIVLILTLLSICRAVKVYHTLENSEHLDILARSARYWSLDVVPTDVSLSALYDENWEIYLLKPHVIFLCGEDEILERLSTVPRGTVIVNDKDDPTVLIGEKTDLQKYVIRAAVTTRLLEDFIHVLRDEGEIGMQENGRAYNYMQGTRPCVITAPLSKLNVFFRFANYIPNVNAIVTWSQSYKWHGYCHVCKELKGTKKLDKSDRVVIAGFILQWTPMLRNWLTALLKQVLPAYTQQFYLIYCNVSEHEALVDEVVKSVQYDGLVLKSDFFSDKNLSDVRKHSVTMCTAVGCTYLFTVDSEVSILRNNIITHLAQYDLSVIAPLVKNRDIATNFWGDVTPDGWYKRSPDYWDIVDGAVGMFVVPFINALYLTKASALPNYDTSDRFEDSDTDIAMATNYRDNATLMWLDTTLLCGVLTVMTKVDHPLPDPDLYAIRYNWHGWVDFALHKDIAFTLTNVEELVGPCSESLVLQLFTESYCAAFITALADHEWRKTGGVELVNLSEFDYHDVVETMVFKSVVPYLKLHLGIDGDVTISETYLFSQDTSTEVLSVSPRGSYHVMFFLSDNSEQGVHVIEEGCRIYLPPGAVLVLQDTGTPLNLIPAEQRNIGIYTKLYVL